MQFGALSTTGIIPNKPQLVNRFCEKSKKSFWQGMEGGLFAACFSVSYDLKMNGFF